MMKQRVSKDVLYDPVKRKRVKELLKNQGDQISLVRFKKRKKVYKTSLSQIKVCT